MERFIHYVFITSLTLLFILLGGFIAQERGMVIALLISVAIYTSVYTYKKIKAQEDKIEILTDQDQESTIYTIVNRLVKRTDIHTPVRNTKNKKNFTGVHYGTV